MTSRTTHKRPLYNVLCRAVVGLVIFAGAVGCINDSRPDLLYSSQSDHDDVAWAQGTDRPPEPKTLFALAKLMITQGRDDQAQFVLARIIQEHPDFLAAYVEQAELHLRHRRTHAAQEVLKEGLTVSPHDPVLLNDLGMCWLFRKDYDQALKQFTEASAAGPDNARYRANMALALGMAGRYDECLAAYQQVLRPADAHFNLAVICDARNDSVRAATEYDRAIQLGRPAAPPDADENSQPTPGEQSDSDGQLTPAERVDLHELSEPDEPLAPQEPSQHAEQLTPQQEPASAEELASKPSEPDPQTAPQEQPALDEQIVPDRQTDLDDQAEPDEQTELDEQVECDQQARRSEWANFLVPTQQFPHLVEQAE